MYIKNERKFLYTLGLLLIVVMRNVQAATVVPKITAVSVTPMSAPAGTMFKFSATLNTPLTAGNKIKIDLGKGAEVMTGTKTSYSLSRAIFTTGSQTYKVGLYDSKNILQGTLSSGSYTVSSTSTLNHAPTLTLISANSSVNINTASTVTLNAKDVDANLNSITMSWGDNTAPETLIAKESKDLVFRHTYTSASSFSWKAFATDSGVPALSSTPITQILTVTSNYTKIANNGSVLADDAKLGANATDWACTKDNKTGLIWEIKTSDGGLRDSKKVYTNYTADYPKCVSSSSPSECKDKGHTGVYGDSANANSFVTAVNAQVLCGATNWRLPTNEELKGLVYCSDGKTKIVDKDKADYICTGLPSRPTINTTYFPNTPADWFWSSSSSKNYIGNAWIVYFNYGYTGESSKDGGNSIRLVRNAQ